MDTKKIFSVLLLLGAEALVIICFLYFGSNLDPSILTLNICVTTIILLLLYFDIVLPRINLKDKPQRAIGTLGLRGVVAFIYMFSAIAVMITFLMVKQPIDIYPQVIVHLGLVFLLALGLYYVMAASVKVNEVFLQETKNRSRLDEMKKATKDVQIKFDQMKNIPEVIIKRVNDLQDNLRYISPTDIQDAIGLESDFLNEMKSVLNSLFDIPLDYEKIIENIKNCERIYKERKQIYSN